MWNGTEGTFPQSQLHLRIKHWEYLDTSMHFLLNPFVWDYTDESLYNVSLYHFRDICLDWEYLPTVRYDARGIAKHLCIRLKEKSKLVLQVLTKKNGDKLTIMEENHYKAKTIKFRLYNLLLKSKNKCIIIKTAKISKAYIWVSNQDLKN